MPAFHWANAAERWCAVKALLLAAKHYEDIAQALLAEVPPAGPEPFDKALRRIDTARSVRTLAERFERQAADARALSDRIAEASKTAARPAPATVP